MNDVLKISQISAKYHLKVPKRKTGDAGEAFSQYLRFCPAAQSVIGCIQIMDDVVLEELNE